MNCEDIKLVISDYLDGEFSKEQESFLFTHLASCSDCREDFKIQSSIQHTTKTNMKEVPESFEKKLFAGIEKEEKTFANRWITKPTPVYFNYILGVVILALTLFSFYQISTLRYDLNVFQSRYETSLQQINYQSMQMYNMMNSLPAIEIEPTKQTIN